MVSFRLPGPGGGSSDDIDGIITSGGQTSSTRLRRFAEESLDESFSGSVNSRGRMDGNPHGGSPPDSLPGSPGSGGSSSVDGSGIAATTTTTSQATETTVTDSKSMSTNATSTPTNAASTTSNSSRQMLPIWAIVVIIIGVIMALTFIVSLSVFCVRERQKSYQRGNKTNYSRAVRRALAAATGAFIPIWIAKRFSSKRRKGAQQDEAYTKIDALLNHEHSQSSLSYVSPAPQPEPQPEPEPALAPALTYTQAPVSTHTPVPAPVPASARASQLRRNPSVVSSLSADSGRGRYERVGIGQSIAEESGSSRGAAGLQRNPSLVSALSSMDERREYSTNDIPPPTPMSDGAPTFTSSERPPNRHLRDHVEGRNPVYYNSP